MYMVCAVLYGGSGGGVCVRACMHACVCVCVAVCVSPCMRAINHSIILLQFVTAPVTSVALTSYQTVPFHQVMVSIMYCIVLYILCCITVASVGLDGYHGVGTALESWVRIPKPGGVRKGWMKQYAIICDFKLFVHNLQADTPTMSVTHLFDIK